MSRRKEVEKLAKTNIFVHNAFVMGALGCLNYQETLEILVLTLVEHNEELKNIILERENITPETKGQNK